MAPAGYRALDNVHCGHSPIVHAGELIPDTYLDSLGDEQQVDFDRLVELGVAQDASLPYGEDAPDGAADAGSAPPDAPENLARLKVDELKQLAAAEGLEGVSELKKDELVAAIEQHRAAAAE